MAATNQTVSSTTNLLGAVNIVLATIGERGVTNLTSPTAAKCAQVLRDATQELSNMNEWSWQYNIIPALSWSNENAYLGDIQRLKAITCNTTAIGTGSNSAGITTASNGFARVGYVNPPDFDSLPLVGYDDSTLNSGQGLVPRMYTAAGGYNTFRLNPYPTGAQGQAQIQFYVIKPLVSPTNPTDTFPMPERFLQLLYYRGSQVMCMQHLDDQNAAQFFMQQYQILTQQFRDRERNMPTDAATMFRYRRARLF